MSARDIIADILWPVQDWDGIEANAAGAADAILEALTASGYRIVGPGEMDAVTVEACAKVADDHAATWGLAMASPAIAIAAAIRALSAEERG
jgi:hypothetical protein